MTGLGLEDVGHVTHWLCDGGKVVSSYPSFHFLTCEMEVVTLTLSAFQGCSENQTR